MKKPQAKNLLMYVCFCRMVPGAFNIKKFTLNHYSRDFFAFVTHTRKLPDEGDIFLESSRITRLFKDRNIAQKQYDAAIKRVKRLGYIEESKL